MQPNGQTPSSYEQVSLSLWWATASGKDRRRNKSSAAVRLDMNEVLRCTTHPSKPEQLRCLLRSPFCSRPLRVFASFFARAEKFSRPWSCSSSRDQDREHVPHGLLLCESPPMLHTWHGLPHMQRVASHVYDKSRLFVIRTILRIGNRCWACLSSHLLICPPCY